MSGAGARGVDERGIPRNASDASGVYRTLNDWQMAFGAVVGCMRNSFALGIHGRPKYGQDSASRSEDDILGARGEIIIALDLNIFWDGTVGQWGGPDVGRLQVRTRSENWHDLIVYLDADPRDTYVLVVGTGPRFRIVGSIRAAKAKQTGVLMNPGERAGGAGYFLPQHELDPYDRAALRRIACGA